MSIALDHSVYIEPHDLNPPRATTPPPVRRSCRRRLSPADETRRAAQGDTSSGPILCGLIEMERLRLVRIEVTCSAVD